ncbi:MAG: hypothetical protein ACR2NZ_24455, partial [Rubripirellula sp.]
MKRHHITIPLVFTLGWIASTWGIPLGKSVSTAQETSESRDLSYAEAELELTKAQLEYAKNSNEELGGGIYSAALLQELDLKREILEVYIDEQNKPVPNLQNVFIKKAEARLAIAQSMLESETIEQKRRIR